jgi:hypothetical protein
VENSIRFFKIETEGEWAKKKRDGNINKSVSFLSSFLTLLRTTEMAKIAIALLAMLVACASAHYIPKDVQG